MNAKTAEGKVNEKKVAMVRIGLVEAGVLSEQAPANQLAVRADTCTVDRIS